MCENEKKDDEELKFERYTHKANAFPGHLALKLLFIYLFIYFCSVESFSKAIFNQMKTKNVFKS